MDSMDTDKRVPTSNMTTEAMDRHQAQTTQSLFNSVKLYQVPFHMKRRALCDTAERQVSHAHSNCYQAVNSTHSISNLASTSTIL